MIAYDRYLAILAESDSAVQAAAEAAFVKLLEKIRAGAPPRTALNAILKEFNADAMEGFREALNAILESSLGPKDIKAYKVGNVKLSDVLYANAQAVSANTQRIIEQHMQGLHDARELRKALYEGYNFQDDPLKVVKPLPKYLQGEFDKFKAAALKTPALRAAYLEAIRKKEAGAGMDEIEKRLHIAFYERNRYFANRIARTELHRNYTDKVATELMEEEQIEYVQYRMSVKHPRSDQCDAMAKVDRYGLGPGVFPKADAPKPPLHPFCRCVVSPRVDIDPKKPPRFNQKAERAFLASLSPQEAARVAGSYAKRLRVLDGGETLEAIYNEGQDELYKWKRLGEFGETGRTRSINSVPIVQYPIPDYREAKTAKEAATIAQQIIDARGPVDYAKRSNGQEIARFRHIGTKDPVNDRYGKVSNYKFDPEEANRINKFLIETAEEADRLGIPRLRGITGKGSAASNGSMGDGVLFVNPSNNKKLFANIDFRSFLQDQIDGADENLAFTNTDLDTLSEEEFLDFRSNWKKIRDDASAKLARLNAGESEDKIMTSQWKFGDDPKKRPFSSTEYKFTDKIDSVLWHEFGHHIHQQIGVEDSLTYKNPPMETLLKDLYSKCKDRPTGYSTTNHFEWFAESFALYKQGREDLVPPPLLELIKHLYATGGKLP